MPASSKPEESLLGRAFREATELRTKMQSEGASRAECDAVVAAHLRRAWPFPHASGASSFLCEQCEDTGWVLQRCEVVRCARIFEHKPHDFVVPCTYCERGRRHLPPSSRPAPASQDAGTQRPERRKNWTRFGGG